MGQSSSNDKTTYNEEKIMHQFDRKCKLALGGEVVDYERHMAYRRSHEIMFSELSEQELNRLSVVDEYELDNYCFSAGGYDVEVKDALLAEAIKTLTDRKRDVVLLSYFLGMSDTDIARELKLANSTVHVHRTRSLELLKQKLEEKIVEGNKKKQQ